MKSEKINSSVENITGSTYILLIYLDKDYRLLIGKLGWTHLKKGYYIYIGSARKRIKYRLARHLLRRKKKHWHIDYILSDPCPSKIIHIWAHPVACECPASRKLFQDGFCQVVKKGLGSSDCNCISHFFKIDTASLTRLDHRLAEMGFSTLTDLNF